MTEHSRRFPIQHLVGFISSIVLTLLAVWAALGTDLPTVWIVVSIMGLAIIQAGIQLFMFMHMTEWKSGNGHVPWNMIFHGFVLAVIVVAGSFLTMFSGHGSGGHGEGHQQQEQQHEEHGQHGQH